MKDPKLPIKAATIRDVASRAGVSKSTVSLALRSDPRIALATREKVLRSAEALNYRPDPLVGVLLSQVRRGTSRAYQSNLAMVDGFQVRGEWKRYHSMRSIISGAEAHAKELGFGWEHHWLNDPACPQERLYQILRARGILGLLVMDSSDAVTLPLDSFAIANVMTLETSYPAAAVDSLRLGQHLRDGLARRGYRRIGHVLCEFSPGSATSMAHWPYRLRRLDRQEVDADLLIVRESGPFHFLDDLKPLFWPWFKRYRPDVIVSSEQSVYEWLKLQGLRVPEDVGFAMIDRDPADPHFAGVDALHALHGAAAVDLVVGQLQRGERGLHEHPKRVFLEPKWIDGPSAPGPVPSSKHRSRLLSPR